MAKSAKSMNVEIRENLIDLISIYPLSEIVTILLNIGVNHGPHTLKNLYEGGQPTTGLVTGYYFEDHSLEGFNYEMGIAVITIQAHSDDWEACKTSGEYVLSTLHAP
jgi:hypothetical protein